MFCLQRGDVLGADKYDEETFSCFLCVTNDNLRHLLMHILSEFVVRARPEAVIKSPFCSCGLCALSRRRGLSLG